MAIEQRSFMFGFILACLTIADKKDTPLELRSQCKRLGMTPPTIQELVDMQNLMSYVVKLYRGQKGEITP